MKQSDEYWFNRVKAYFQWEEALGWGKSSDAMDGSNLVQGTRQGDKTPNFHGDRGMIKFMTDLKQTAVERYFNIRFLVTGELDDLKRECEVVAAQEFRRMEKEID